MHEHKWKKVGSRPDGSWELICDVDGCDDTKVVPGPKKEESTKDGKRILMEGDN